MSGNMSGDMKPAVVSRRGTGGNGSGSRGLAANSNRTAGFIPTGDVFKVGKSG